MGLKNTISHILKDHWIKKNLTYVCKITLKSLTKILLSSNSKKYGKSHPLAHQQFKSLFSKISYALEIRNKTSTNLSAVGWAISIHSSLNSGSLPEILEETAKWNYSIYYFVCFRNLQVSHIIMKVYSLSVWKAFSGWLPLHCLWSFFIKSCLQPLV